MNRTFAAAVLSALAAVAIADAAVHQLSDGEPFSGFADENIHPPVFSPDGVWAVYVQDADVDEAAELWSVRVGGGTPIRLSGQLAPGSSVFRFQITPDSRRVVFQSPQDGAGWELFSIPIGGGALAELSQPLASSGVLEFGISPDGDRVVYVGAFTDPNELELWAVDTVGGAASRVRLYGPLPAGRALRSVQFALDRVLFLAELAAGKIELFRSDLDGGGATKIHADRSAETEIGPYRVTSDQQTVVFRESRDLGLPNPVELLYSVATLGGSEELLAGILSDDLDIVQLRLTPNGSHALFLANLEFDDRRELWSVELPDGAPVRLNEPLGPDGDVIDYEAGPQSNFVAYIADPDVESRFEIFTVPPEGGESVRLNGALTPGTAVEGFAIHPQSAWVAYVADQSGLGTEVWASAPSGGGADRWSERPLFLESSDAGVLAFSADGGQLYYQRTACVDFPSPSCADSIRAYDLAASVDRSVRAQAAGGGLQLYPSSPTARGALFRNDQGTGGSEELFLGDPCVFCDGFEAGSTLRW